MSYDDEPHECVCTNPTHGGKLWLCNTELCLLNKPKCQATFKEHCTYPECDCDRVKKDWNI